MNNPVPVFLVRAVMLFSALHFQVRRTQLIFSHFLAKSFTTKILKNNIYVGADVVSARERCYSDFLKNAHHTSDLLHGKAVHAQLLKYSFMSNSIFLQNFLLSMYMKFSDFDSALQLFDEMPLRNAVSWTSIISGFVRKGQPDKGLLLFSCMLRDAVTPNEFTLVAALNGSSFSCSVYEAYGIYALVIKLGFGCNVYISNGFLTSLIRNGCLTDAVNVFNECLNKDTVSWNAMFSGYLQHSPSEIPGFWLRMIREGMKPDGFTFSTVLCGLAGLRDDAFGVQVHGQLVKYGHGSETCVGNSLADMYLKFGDLVGGLKAFDEISCKNVLSWTAMATGCLSCGAPNKALWVLEEMKVRGVKPNLYSVAATFKACASMASLDEGKKAHTLRVKLGNEMDVCVDNALLGMYVKCGCMDSALKVFRIMNGRTIVTWTTMVMGYAQNGQAREALRVFEEMVEEGVKPNYITFVCVLYACSQAGYVEEGWKYFSSMTSQFGVSPGEDHYVCMVDLLGRSGLIKEAEELISRMAFPPSPLVWQSLLASCHIHGNIKAGKCAAASLMHLNQTCASASASASACVTLSNLFASSNDWEGAEILREMMETRNISKIPGASSVTSVTSMDIATCWSF